MPTNPVTHSNLIYSETSRVTLPLILVYCDKLDFMKKSKFIYSMRTRIIVICLFVFLTLYIGSLFTDIIKENPIYEGGFWFTILAWIITMYFDGKAK